MSLLLLALLSTPPATCESLSSLKLRDATITLAQSMPAGTFTRPDAPAAPTAKPAPPIVDLPPFCRVAATLKPTTDSDIKIEVWLPLSGWNGKFQAVGNGGWAGSITYSSGAAGIERGMAEALKRGYATASTDTGHVGADTRFAFGHPEKMVDFAYRAVHEMAVASKAIIAAFYGQPARLSYWNGCSTGGRQGLMEAQRYPDDFDGIIAGAPANYMTHLSIGHMAHGVAALKQKESNLTPQVYPLLRNAAIQACDANDGLQDGLLTDPRTCRFNPEALRCRAGNSADCLTAPQIETVKKMYAPVRKANGEVIFPGLQPTSEPGWVPVISGPEPFAISMWMFRLVHDDLSWDWRTFDLEADLSLANRKLGFLNAIDPDLRKFKGRGGKLLLYHGWNDQLIAPENTINYYDSVLAKIGGQQGDWIRLFMAPGMNHCAGGAGPNAFDAVAALEQWVERKQAPEQIVASHSANGKVDRTRPLCPYPQVATYKGSGSIDDAVNFICKAP